ncbi:PepSY domain-containing protein [Parvularcula sp. LCG005]|uniref:PepSY domain-containing protein n=1 Tax=Parvularcula sp. LCG005 TaxID=3078805 RepID=UPI00294397D9|nr:PepSY domain-containing protein [Parvularcula sp. LCG005]WOI52180.1 PepSY domain-containing protein [Parvularcula sp. LCG005]
MALLRWAVRLHKWIALIIGVQVLLWILGGFVMSVLPIERVRGDHKVADAPIVAVDPGAIVSLEQAVKAAGMEAVENATLSRLLGEPVWELHGGARTVIVEAKEGTIISPVPQALARQIAEYDFAGDGQVASVKMLTDPPSEYGPGGPVWQVQFDDAGNTRLYVDPDTGKVRARRSDTWRLFDFFWRLHVMDYDDGADFNHPLLIVSAGLGLLVSVSGLTILVFRMRRSYGRWQSVRRRR